MSRYTLEMHDALQSIVRDARWQRGAGLLGKNLYCPVCHYGKDCHERKSPDCSISAFLSLTYEDIVPPMQGEDRPDIQEFFDSAPEIKAQGTLGGTINADEQLARWVAVTVIQANLIADAERARVLAVGGDASRVEFVSAAGVLEQLAAAREAVAKEKAHDK